MQSEPFPDNGGIPVKAIKASIEVSATVNLNLISVHFPQKKAQIPLFNSLLDLPSAWLDECSLLIGDFNCGIPLVDSASDALDRLILDVSYDHTVRETKASDHSLMLLDIDL